MRCCFSEIYCIYVQKRIHNNITYQILGDGNNTITLIGENYDIYYVEKSFPDNISFEINESVNVENE